MTLKEEFKDDPRWNDKNFRSCCILVHSRVVPRYLYKFCKVDENLIKNIKNNQLWFSTKDDFNDPFDCQINLTKSMSRKEIEELVEEFIKMGIFPSFGKNEIIELVKNKPEVSKKIVNDSISKQLKQLGICCFSKEKDYIPMWSHYADKHKGVCLKFDVLKDTDFFFAGGSKPIVLISNVEYCNKYPLISVYNAMIGKSVTRELPFLKSFDWIYEKEFRLISDKLGGIRFNKAALIEVNFGDRTNKLRKTEKTPITKLDLIESIKEADYPNIKFYQAKPSENRFELNFSISKV